MSPFLFLLILCFLLENQNWLDIWNGILIRVRHKCDGSMFELSVHSMSAKWFWKKILWNALFYKGINWKLMENDEQECWTKAKLLFTVQHLGLCCSLLIRTCDTFLCGRDRWAGNLTDNGDSNAAGNTPSVITASFPHSHNERLI